MTTAALIVAAGRGSRMARDIPKQYLTLGAHAVLHHTARAFLSLAEIGQVQVVIHADDQTLYDHAVAAIADARLRPPVIGGATRAQSVRSGLQALKQDAPDHVLIHDAARPFCPPETMRAVLAALADADGAFAALPVVDALWHVAKGHADVPVSRDGLWRAQTPQAFRYAAILAAHARSDGTAADDVEIARQAGLNVRVVEGHEDNFKITRPQDLARAERLLAERDTDV